MYKQINNRNNNLYYIELVQYMLTASHSVRGWYLTHESLVVPSCLAGNYTFPIFTSSYINNQQFNIKVFSYCWNSNLIATYSLQEAFPVWKADDQSERASAALT